MLQDDHLYYKYMSRCPYSFDNDLFVFYGFRFSDVKAI